MGLDVGGVVTKALQTAPKECLGVWRLGAFRAVALGPVLGFKALEGTFGTKP